MAIKTLKNPYRLQKVMLKFPRRGKKPKHEMKNQKLRIQWLWWWRFSRLRTKIDYCKICHRPILAVYLKDFFCLLELSQLFIENYAHCWFRSDSRHFFISSLSANAHYNFYSGIVDPFYFHSLIKSTFLSSKRLLCLHDNRNNTCCSWIWNFSSHVQLDSSRVSAANE